MSECCCNCKSEEPRKISPEEMRAMMREALNDPEILKMLDMVLGQDFNFRTAMISDAR